MDRKVLNHLHTLLFIDCFKYI